MLARTPRARWQEPELLAEGWPDDFDPVPAASLKWPSGIDRSPLGHFIAADQTHFINTFRHLMGMTPGAFRSRFARP